MSVLIKGMKMPKTCIVCWLSPICPVWVKEVSRYKGYDNRLPDCPLVEVPTPHGRLIDEKQIPYIDLNADMPQSKVRVWTTFKDKIDRLPTIIEAEGEEK